MRAGRPGPLRAAGLRRPGRGPEPAGEHHPDLRLRPLLGGHPAAQPVTGRRVPRPEPLACAGPGRGVAGHADRGRRRAAAADLSPAPGPVARCRGAPGLRVGRARRALGPGSQRPGPVHARLRRGDARGHDAVRGRALDAQRRRLLGLLRPVRRALAPALGGRATARAPPAGRRGPDHRAPGHGRAAGGDDRHHDLRRLHRRTASSLDTRTSDSTRAWATSIRSKYQPWSADQRLGHSGPSATGRRGPSPADRSGSPAPRSRFREARCRRPARRASAR